MSYFTTDFHLFRDAQPQGDIGLQATPFTHIMFSLNDGCTFYLSGLKWALKSSSSVTAAEPDDGGLSAFLGFVFISQYQSLTYTIVGLVSCKWFRGWTILPTSPDIGKATMKSETIICTHRGNENLPQLKFINYLFLLDPDIHSKNIQLSSSCSLCKFYPLLKSSFKKKKLVKWTINLHLSILIEGWNNTLMYATLLSSCNRCVGPCSW